MQDVSDLKNIIIQSLESKGVLSELRAQIRASIFKTIEDEEAAVKENFDWENKKSIDISKNEELILICHIFEEFLTFFKLEYTANIFSHEANFKNCQDFNNLSNIKRKKIEHRKYFK